MLQLQFAYVEVHGFPYKHWSNLLNQWSVIFGGDAFFQATILSVNKTWKAVLGF